MSVTRDHLDAALSEVRVSPELRRRVMRGLRGKPHGRIRPRRALVVCALALAVALFAVFAAPPIVRAAGQWFERFFGGPLAEIERYEALPTDARFEKELSQSESTHMTYRVDASAQVHGVTVTVGWVEFTASDWFPPTENGKCNISLSYDRIPPFDPSYTDFALSIGGIDIPMNIGDQLRDYREQGLRSEWGDGRFDGKSSGSNSRIELIGAGPPFLQTYLDFSVERWKVEKSMDCVLKGEIDGEWLVIPFVFDPAKAHERAAEQARKDAQWRGQYNQEEKKRIEQAAKNAVSVGITKREGDVELTLHNLSYTKGTLMLTSTVKGASIERGFPTVSLRRVAVDGVNVIDGSGSSAVLEADLLSLSGEYPLSGKRPKESLIYIDVGDKYPGIRLAFKYRWKEKQVILPADEAEEAEWFTRGKPAPLE